MKIVKYIFGILLAVSIVSCASIQVNEDYDTSVNFNNYRTFAFDKKGIDKAKISDLDKRRILYAIENNLVAKGMTKSENPDMLISIFTKARKDVNVYQNNFGWYGYGYYGWYPWYYGGVYSTWPSTQVTESTTGTLYIDFIDAKKYRLIWQGIGKGSVSETTSSPEKKTEMINEFVNAILKQYPPGSPKK
ncbi:DUF4136 domain-containing protein [Aureivirga sp. CE67]|uniref:DUF4136 domain-containing protein n=1 Tax=Aureivirga sp. CE67 TaxID=1788983 RepID=UPI0018CB166A|nr:DUF4136 domain-containing protein [Aureivirga sp. CE67]